MKYTREDVIVWADDDRLKGAIGKKAYFGENPNDVLHYANENRFAMKLYKIEKSSDHPFMSAETAGWHFIVLKKKEEKSRKTVPFDFSLEEDRRALMGRRIRKESKSPYYIWEAMVTAFNVHGYHEDWHVVADNGLMQVSAEELFEDWTFADTGEPVGKEVES